MITRTMTPTLVRLHQKYPVVFLTGPRQSGKTTLLKAIFDNKPYVSFENIDTKEYAKEDPRGFLSQYKEGAIFDEVQNVPQIFSYLQEIVDSDSGIKFILSGSQNFLINEKITQSLAGRTAVLRLLPLSFAELRKTDISFESYEELLFKGMYPRIYDKDIAPNDFYPFYIQTYIERDVRQIKNIQNLHDFTLFLKLCAGRVGQLLNVNQLASEIGINHNTAKSWLSILEASYIIYFLRPHHNNLNKRLTKMPKLYFYDTGLVASLLSIKTPEQLATHYSRGAIFENFILNQLVKYEYNNALTSNLYFWRNNHGKEIDCIVDKGQEVTPLEIKASKTFNNSFFRNLKYYMELNKKTVNTSVIYGGDMNIEKDSISLISWKSLSDEKYLKKIIN